MTAGTTPTVQRDGHVAVVEIDRPPANHFDLDTMSALVATLAVLDEDPGCRAVVLAAAGPHFCAGMDFGGSAPGADTAASAAEFYGRAAGLFDLGTPVVAAVQGAAVGGGLGLACAADFRVADESTRFVANFARLGFHHGFGLSVTLPAIVGDQMAADLLLTGRRLDGRAALAAGLADRLAGPGRLRDEAVALAAQIAAAAPLAVHAIRRTLRGDLAARVRTALAGELAEQRRLWSTADAAEGIAAGAARRPPVFTGH